jgi:hypothetical protein
MVAEAAQRHAGKGIVGCHLNVALGNALRQGVMAEVLEQKLSAGQDIDVAAHAQLSSTLVRLASRIGINRIAKQVPTLQEYLQTKAAEKEAAE